MVDERRLSHQRTRSDDLDEIWLYVARDRPITADRLMDRFQSTFALLASQPLVGEPRPELAPRLRTFRVGSYAIYYRAREGDPPVEIVRILHGARDMGDARLA